MAMMCSLQIRERENIMWRNWLNSVRPIGVGFAVELHVHGGGNNNERVGRFLKGGELLNPRGLEAFLRRVLRSQGVAVDSPTLNYLVCSALGILWSIRINSNIGWSLIQVDLFITLETTPLPVVTDSSLVLDSISESQFGSLSGPVLDESLVLDAESFLPRSIIKLEEEKAEVKMDEDCCICLASVEIGEKVSKLPCSHVFHSNCIASWIPRNPSCPLCRASLLLSSS